MVQLASSVETLLQQQRDFFDAGRTQPVAFRIEQLQRLKQAVLDRQNALMDALRADLRSWSHF